MVNFDLFVDFCRLQLATGDYDAHIPFLKALAEHQGLTLEESVWLGFLYMAYYSEGSAWIAFTSKGVRGRKRLPPFHLPITTQRRNLYGGRIERHVRELYALNGPLSLWLRPCENWEQLLATIGNLYGNGRWASYTTAELMTHLNEMEIEPSTYEILESSGPRKGLTALGMEPSEGTAQKVHEQLQRRLGKTIPSSVLESLLCDWAGMNKGTFYAGRNIDRQQARILDVEELTGRACPTLWAVRARTFPPETLGEVNGWVGIDKDRLKAYQRCKRVLSPKEGRG